MGRHREDGRRACGGLPGTPAISVHFSEGSLRKEGLMRVSVSHKSRVETSPTASKSRRTQHRRVKATMLHGDPHRANATKLPRRRFLHVAAGAVAVPAVSRIAMAQTHPTRPITIIVPYPAGGGADANGRIVAERMRASLGQ